MEKQNQVTALEQPLAVYDGEALEQTVLRVLLQGVGGGWVMFEPHAHHGDCGVSAIQIILQALFLLITTKEHLRGLMANMLAYDHKLSPSAIRALDWILMNGHAAAWGEHPDTHRHSELRIEAWQTARGGFSGSASMPPYLQPPEWKQVSHRLRDMFVHEYRRTERPGIPSLYCSAALLVAAVEELGVGRGVQPRPDGRPLIGVLHINDLIDMVQRGVLQGATHDAYLVSNNRHFVAIARESAVANGSALTAEVDRTALTLASPRGTLPPLHLLTTQADSEGGKTAEPAGASTQPEVGSGKPIKSKANGGSLLRSTNAFAALAFDLGEDDDDNEEQETMDDLVSESQVHETSMTPKPQSIAMMKKKKAAVPKQKNHRQLALDKHADNEDFLELVTPFLESAVNPPATVPAPQRQGSSRRRNRRGNAAARLTEAPDLPATQHAGNNSPVPAGICIHILVVHHGGKCRSGSL